ncbi:MAG: ABC transporter permease [Deltaproteobacteria bacterium]|nr:ABC transporter permease [Deltaproteobacteria bacterium]MBW2542853.1 ABC transporter permease [Deltaproteobacteria bacterium]
MIGRIWAMAVNTAREAVRNKLLYTLLFFALIMMLFGTVLSALSYVDRERMVQDFAFSSIRLFSVAIAVFVGVGLIHKEVERRTVYTILSKPLSRAEFLIGKYTGLVLIIWLQVAIMALFFAGVSLLLGAPLGFAHLAALALTAVELALVVALATLFSSFTTPLLSSFFSCGLWIAGHLTRDLRDHGASSASALVREGTTWMHRILPDLESFNLSLEAAHQLPVAASDVWFPALYGAGYVAAVLAFAVMIFERRDFR